MLAGLVTDFARGIEAADSQAPVASNSRTGVSYQPGIGPHAEAQTVKLVMAHLADADPERYASHRLGVPCADGTRQACDVCLDGPEPWEWAIEVKMLRLMGDNGKLVLPRLGDQEIQDAAQGQLSLDGLTRQLIRQSLSYRFALLSDAATARAVEKRHPTRRPRWPAATTQRTSQNAQDRHGLERKKPTSDCCQAAGRYLSCADKPGTSTQSADRIRHAWTTCPELRI
jgi:hypothetical protein